MVSAFPLSSVLFEWDCFAKTTTAGWGAAAELFQEKLDTVWKTSGFTSLSFLGKTGASWCSRARQAAFFFDFVSNGSRSQ
jgi:hypothetical protein